MTTSNITPKNATITSTTPVGVPNPAGSPAPLVLPARPEPVALHAANSALVVVDMQNAYASVGGYVDSAGFDISGAQGTIENISRSIAAARAGGMLVIYLQNGWDAAYVEAGGPGSPNYYKSNALKTMRKRRELHGKFLAKGGWDYELIDAMKPQDGDIVIAKTRYSGFFNSTLDSTLRARGIRNLVFTGIATNVCVESTLRDAFHLEYFAVMLEDATHELGGAAIQQATVYNVETFFGWVSTVDAFCNTVGRPAAAAAPKVAQAEPAPMAEVVSPS
ncbi:MAG: rutB [Rhizobacter sp.]|nr:rutB [Rhizobacter sp.]